MLPPERMTRGRYAGKNDFPYVFGEDRLEKEHLLLCGELNADSSM